MPRRDDDNFDDDDYLPPERAGESTGRRTSRGVFIVVAAIGLALGAVAVLFLMRGQRAAEHARAIARDNEQRVIAAQKGEPVVLPRRPILTKAAETAPRGNPGTNWKAVVGTWRRTDGEDEDDCPTEIEFRDDFSARVTRVRPTQTIIHETLVEVRDDADDRLSLVLHHEKGESHYTFHTRPEGTLLFDHRKGGYTFVRVK
jgi:hypothetical protein